MPLHTNAPTLDEVMQRLANGDKENPDHDWGLSWVIARNAIRLFSLIPRVLFLRSRFGERYMQAYHVAGSWCIAAFAAVGAALSGVSTPWNNGPRSSSPFVGALFLFAYTVMLGLRFFGVVRRRRRNDFSVHSYSEGEAWSVWERLGVPPNVVGMVIEPAIILMVGYALGHAFELPTLQFLTWVCAIAHFAEQQIVAAKERARLLDAADSLIDQRMAEERLAIIRAGASVPLQQPPVAAPDQAALQNLLAQTRADAKAQPQPTAGE